MPDPNDANHQLQDMGVPVMAQNHDSNSGGTSSGLEDSGPDRRSSKFQPSNDEQINQEALLAYYNTSGGSMHPSSSGIAPPSGRFTPYTAYQGNTQVHIN